MGWISVGLLILSSGCVLYKHPPVSFIQSILGWGLFCSGSQKQPQPKWIEDDDALNGKQKEHEPGHKSLSNNVADNIIEKHGSVTHGSVTHGSAAPPIALRPPQPTAVVASINPVPTLSTSEPLATQNSKPTERSSMPPPPRPVASVPLRPPPSAAASLRVPNTKTIPSTALAPSRLSAAPVKASRKVTLAPGHSPLDWAKLTSNPNSNLHGHDAPSDGLIRVRPSRLKQQNGRHGRDAWSEYQGKVYNITPYLPFHPGGEGELMRGAGRDAGKLFMEVHPWVNWEAMLSECLVGILVEEHDNSPQTSPLLSSESAAHLDEMD